ncbi:hypothetical protein OROGR_007391 [Orobanche gracilis]
MVGFVQNEGAIEEEKDDIKIQPVTDSKRLPITNEPLDLCQLELEEDFLSYCDSIFDFDSNGGGLMEGNPGICGDPDMANLGGNPVYSGSYVVDELGAYKKVEAEEDLGESEGSLLALGQEKEEPGVVERIVEEGKCEQINLQGVLGGYEAESSQLGGLGCLIEEKLGKVSLGGNIGIDSSSHSGGGSNIKGHGMKVDETVSDEDEISSSSSSSSSDSSSSSSSSGEEEDEEGGAMSGEKKAKDEIRSVEEETDDIEEGEIILSDTDGLVASSDHEDVESGPITSKNELKFLPPVPSISVTLQPHHQTLPVGVILSIIGAQVIVEGIERHNPLNEGSILWITESRLPLGVVDEIFGPVKNPYYIVRYNSEDEVPTIIQQGTLVSFVQEFANHVLNDKSLYQKGYDASGENDEELSDELEFSDDEKEAEYRRMLKMKKRGTNESKPGTRRREKRQQKNHTANWNHNQNPVPQTPSSIDKTTADPGLDNFSSSSGPRYDFAGNQFMVPPFPQPPGFSPCYSGPGQDLSGNQTMVVPSFPHGPQAPGFTPCYSGPGQDLSGNQTTVVPSFPHGTQAPGFTPCYSSPGQDLSGNQTAMAFPFPLVPQVPGFAPPNGFWSNNGFPQQQQGVGLPNGLQQQNVGLLNGLPGNGMLWMKQNGPFHLQTPPLQQQMSTFPGLPLNFNALGGQSSFVGGPMVRPWPTNPNLNTALNQLGMGLHGSVPVNGNGGEQGGQSQGPQNNCNSQQSPESVDFNQGRGGGARRGRGRGGRGCFGGGRGKYQSR